MAVGYVVLEFRAAMPGLKIENWTASTYNALEIEEELRVLEVNGKNNKTVGTKMPILSQSPFLFPLPSPDYTLGHLYMLFLIT
jgi:hypothetical protein